MMQTCVCEQKDGGLITGTQKEHDQQIKGKSSKTAKAALLGDM
jgi:hypothetical protein